MNMKEFNEKKQDIIERIDAAESYALDFNTNMDDEDIARQTTSISVRLHNAREVIKNLQPPTPPTCSTCKYKENSYHLLSEGRIKLGGYYCKNKKVKPLTTDCFGDDDCMELPLRGFGCNRHSDYEVKDENN